MTQRWAMACWGTHYNQQHCCCAQSPGSSMHARSNINNAASGLRLHCRLLPVSSLARAYTAQQQA